jgi:protocatechuate 4,5-dioxygenase alpha chain
VDKLTSIPAVIDAADETRHAIAKVPIFGTPIFGSEEAQRGYALNRMCYSFNSAANREAFRNDEEAYCARFGLDEQQRDAVRRRDVLAMIEAGGNIYYLAKLAGIFGLNVQDIGAQQTGVSVETFRARLMEAAK